MGAPDSLAAAWQEIRVIGDSRVLIAPGLVDEIPSRLHSAGLKPAALAPHSDQQDVRANVSVFVC